MENNFEIRLRRLKIKKIQLYIHRLLARGIQHKQYHILRTRISRKNCLERKQNRCFATMYISEQTGMRPCVGNFPSRTGGRSGSRQRHGNVRLAKYRVHPHASLCLRRKKPLLPASTLRGRPKPGSRYLLLLRNASVNDTR